MSQDNASHLQRLWRDIAHPQRRGPPDPTWAQIAVALIAIGSALLAIDAVTTTTQTTPRDVVVVSSPNQWLIYVAVPMLLLGVLSLSVLAFTATMRWKEDRKTPFLIAHDPNDNQCVENFSDGSRQVRVKVCNIDSIGVERVRSFMRLPNGEDRSHFLHLQHDGDPLRRQSRDGENLTTRQVAYFDIAWRGKDPNHTEILRLNYAEPELQTLSRRTDWPMSISMVIEVSGWRDFRDVVPTSKKFALIVDEKGVVTLNPA